MSVRTRSRLLMRPVRSPLQYLDHEHTFVAGMAKREGPLVFAAAPIVQGDWAASDGSSDSVTFVRGSQIVNQWYDTFDPMQGSVSLWLTPEWDGDDGKEHRFLLSGALLISKNVANDLLLFVVGSAGPISFATSAAALVAGATYNIVMRWDTANTLDGTNHASISIDDVHAFGQTSGITAIDAGTTMSFGSGSARRTPANAIIEGLHIFRRPLYDGEFGVDAGNGDEIARIYAGGVGLDPTLVTGSWGVVFALPTDSAVGAMVTG